MWKLIFGGFDRKRWVTFVQEGLDRDNKIVVMHAHTWAGRNLENVRR